MQLLRILYDQTGSRKSNMAASKLEIPLVDAAILDFSLPVKLNNIPIILLNNWT
jgi:hypothetical protein